MMADEALRLDSLNQLLMQKEGFDPLLILETKEGKIKVRVVSLGGEKLVTKQSFPPGNLTYSLSLNGLSPGIYFVHLQEKNGSEVHKLVLR